MQLAPFTLPAHPFLLAFIPHALAMKKKKARTAAGRRAVALVQPGDTILSDCQKLIVIGKVLAGRIDPIRKQSKVQIPIRIREVMNFQSPDLFFNFTLMDQQGGHDDHRPELFRDSQFQFHSWQRSRPQQIRNRAID